MRVTVASGLRAALTRSLIPLDSMSLLYGDYFDVSAPLVAVATSFNAYGWSGGSMPSDRPAAAWELGRAERRDDAIARGAWTALPADQEAEPAGPFAHDSQDIMVCGVRRSVPVVSYRHYQALEFQTGTTGVTVVSRHQLPDLPRFDWVTDLEPYYSGYSDWVEKVSQLVENIEPPES